MQFDVQTDYSVPGLPDGENTHNPMFISFDSIPTCDGQIDRQPDTALVASALHSLH